MGTDNMNKKIIKTASVIAVGAGAAALYLSLIHIFLLCNGTRLD